MFSSARTRIKNKTLDPIPLPAPYVGFLRGGEIAVVMGPLNYVLLSLGGTHAVSNILDISPGKKWEPCTPHAYGFDPKIRLLSGGDLSMKTLTCEPGDDGAMTVELTVKAARMRAANPAGLAMLLLQDIDITVANDVTWLKQDDLGVIYVFAYVDPTGNDIGPIGDKAKVATALVSLKSLAGAPTSRIHRILVESMESTIKSDYGADLPADLLPRFVVIGVMNVARNQDEEGEAQVQSVPGHGDDGCIDKTDSPPVSELDL